MKLRAFAENIREAVKDKRVYKNLMVLLSLLLSMIAVTFAWFVYSNKSQMDEMTVTAIKAINTKIAIEKEGIYKRDYVITTEDESITEVSGLGYVASSTDLQLFSPKKDLFTGEPLTEDNGQTWILRKGLEEGTEYLEYHVYFKANMESDIFLNPSSSVSPKDINARKSEMGDFSSDYIAGAVRVAIIENLKEQDDKGNEITREKLRLLWAPNKNYELTKKPDGSGFEFNPNGTAEAVYSCYDGTQIIQLSNGAVSLKNGENFVFSTEIAQIGDPSSVKLTTLTGTGDEYTGELTIRVWIEGCDREATNAFSKGCFTQEYIFTAVEVEKEED